MALPTKRTLKENNFLKNIYLFYGEPKAGKTTIASQFGDDEDNKVLFFATEPGHKFQSIYKYKLEDGSDPKSWEDFLSCARDLLTHEHQYKCLVIDIADNLYGWCSDYVCKRENVRHESEEGFGKIYSFVKKEFMVPIRYLTQKGMGIIFISHASTKEKELGKRKLTVTDATMSAGATRLISGLSDYIFYFYTDLEGKRFIRTKGTEVINAGDRSGKLPETIEMNAEILQRHLIHASE